ncbi:hypothetical protein Rs2_41475 [Raphanus sativus]|nr:hypothetical protein Rs2_41475 [Raphanus sativus]
MAELVALETQSLEDENPGEDYVDFVATTTAALGVPSPCLSKRSSFQDSPPAAVELRKLRKGDLEEETELLQALQLSQGNDHGDSANLDFAFTFSDASPTSTHDENICHLEQLKSDGDKAKGGDLDHDQSYPKRSGDETGPDVVSANSNEKAIIAKVTSSEALSVEKTDLEPTKIESLLKSDNATSVNLGSLYSSFYNLSSCTSVDIRDVNSHSISIS